MDLTPLNHLLNMDKTQLNISACIQGAIGMEVLEFISNHHWLMRLHHVLCLTRHYSTH